MLMHFASRPIALVAMITVMVVSGNTDESPALPSIPFDQPGEYEFHFRQPRNREMTLLLEVEPFHGRSESQLLTHLKTTIEVKLVNHAGSTVCQAAGSPGEGIGNDHWVLRMGAGEAAFWHRGCAEVKLKRSESYTLTVRLRNVDPKTPKISVHASFERSDDFGP